MKLFALAAIAGLSLTTAGCIIVDADTHKDDWDMSYSSDSERVYSADITETDITIRVAASGCTTKDFFEADVDHHGGNSFTVEFERERRDYCKMMQPEGETLTYTFSELGIPDGAELKLKNPVGR